MQKLTSSYESEMLKEKLQPCDNFFIKKQICKKSSAPFAFLRFLLIQLREASFLLSFADFAWTGSGGENNFIIQPAFVSITFHSFSLLYRQYLCHSYSIIFGGFGRKSNGCYYSIRLCYLDNGCSSGRHCHGSLAVLK